MNTLGLKNCLLWYSWVKHNLRFTMVHNCYIIFLYITVIRSNTRSTQIWIINVDSTKESGLSNGDNTLL